LDPLRIVVAEDDQDFRELLEHKLRLEFPGADVECVANGREALDALEKKSASAMVIDLQMPILDGVALTALARSRPESANMPILVLTASGGAAEWKRLASMGADRFLVKPANLDDVALLLRQAIRERSVAAAPSAPTASVVPPGK
jgi:DNA-binding response OmpR family regulator